MSYIFGIFMAVYLCSNLLLLAASFRGHHRRPSHPVPQHPSLLHWCKREVTPSLHPYEHNFVSYIPPLHVSKRSHLCLSLSPNCSICAVPNVPQWKSDDIQINAWSWPHAFSKHLLKYIIFTHKHHTAGKPHWRTTQKLIWKTHLHVYSWVIQDTIH